MKHFVVVNPAAAGGRTGKLWPRIQRELRDAIGPFDFALTTKSGEGIALTRAAMARGAQNVIAVGGDGTVNEAINGLCVNGTPPPAHVTLGIVMCGTGSDFRRTFDAPKGVSQSIARLRNGNVQTIDLGYLEFSFPDGTTGKRWFNNIASFGFSGEVVRAVNAAKFSKLLGGRFSFLWNSFWQLQQYPGCKVEFTLDGETLTEDICTLAVCNGRYFGGGMMVAPNADPSDGLFDVILIRQNPPLSVFDMRLLYSGAHLSHPNVTALRGRRIEARPLSNAPVLLDVEGEAPGRLPATFGIVPGALRLRC